MKESSGDARGAEIEPVHDLRIFTLPAQHNSAFGADVQQRRQRGRRSAVTHGGASDNGEVGLQFGKRAVMVVLRQV